MGGVFFGFWSLAVDNTADFLSHCRVKNKQTEVVVFFLKILETLQILLKEGITSFLCLFNGNKAKSVSNYGSKSHLNIHCSHFLP